MVFGIQGQSRIRAQLHQVLARYQLLVGVELDFVTLAPIDDKQEAAGLKNTCNIADQRQTLPGIGDFVKHQDKESGVDGLGRQLDVRRGRYNDLDVRKMFPLDPFPDRVERPFIDVRSEYLARLAYCLRQPEGEVSVPTAHVRHGRASGQPQILHHAIRLLPLVPVLSRHPERLSQEGDYDQTTDKPPTRPGCWSLHAAILLTWVDAIVTY
jgi:hypothetical protein